MAPRCQGVVLVESEILFTIIRESVSLGILIVVLVGGYRLLNKMIDMADKRLHQIEDSMSKLVTILEDFTDA
jgi:hypothetical protein